MQILPSSQQLLAALLAGSFWLAGAPTQAIAQSIGCIWEQKADSPIGRFESGNLVIDDQLYAFGGFYTFDIRTTVRADRYEPLTDQWSQIADIPTPVTHAPYVQEGRHVWLLGGFVGDNPGVATGDVWIYDIDQDVWASGPPLPRPVAGGGAALVGRELHYVSGCEADRITMTADHWAFDLDAPSLGWQPRAPLPQPRCHLGAATLGGEIWIVGGQVGHDQGAFDVPFVHRYSPALDAWSSGPDLPLPRSHYESATFVADGKIYIAGGQDRSSGKELLSGMLALDPAVGAWSYEPPLPFPRHATCVQKIGDYVYVSAGSVPGTPPARDLHRRAFDAEYPNPLRINCGGHERPAASGSCCWCSDIGSESGSTATYNPQSEILGTDEDEVFHRQRRSQANGSGRVDYRFPMGNGHFRVRVFLAERELPAPGQRVMDLVIEDRRLIENLDLFAEVGYSTALVRAFDVEVVDHALNITLHADPSQRALVAALEIERLDPGHIVTQCGSAPNSSGTPGVLSVVGSTSVADDDVTIVASGLPNATFGMLVQASQPGQFQLPGGQLCLSPPFFRLPPEQSVGSVLSHRLMIGQPPVPAQAIAAGSTWYLQCWYRDGGTPAGYGLSDSLRLSFTP